MTPREAAEAGFKPGGPSVQELEALAAYIQAEYRAMHKLAA